MFETIKYDGSQLRYIAWFDPVQTELASLGTQSMMATYL